MRTRARGRAAADLHVHVVPVPLDLRTLCPFLDRYAARSAGLTAVPVIHGCAAVVTMVMVRVSLPMLALLLMRFIVTNR